MAFALGIFLANTKTPEKKNIDVFLFCVGAREEHYFACAHSTEAARAQRMAEAQRATASSADAAAFSRGAETTNNVRTYVLRGQLVAQPFSASRKRPADSVFGKVSTILNPPNLDRSSTYSRQHNATAVTVQTAGTVHKRKVPYSMVAPRNRLDNPGPKRAGPFTSTLDLKNGGVANSTVYPYRTISRTVQKPTTAALETRTGCACSRRRAPLARPLPGRGPLRACPARHSTSRLPPCHTRPPLRLLQGPTPTSWRRWPRWSTRSSTSERGPVVPGLGGKMRFFVFLYYVGVSPTARGHARLPRHWPLALAAPARPPSSAQ